MSDDVKQTWQALGEQMSELGSLVRGRVAHPAGDDGAEGNELGDDGATTATDRIRAALDEVVAATRELAERIGDAARDDEVRASARATMTSLDEALRTSVDDIAGRVERAVRSTSHDTPAPDDD